MSKYKPLLPFLSGVLLVLSFPRPEMAFLAWVALVPLLLACTATAPHPQQEAFKWGFLTGVVYFGGTLWWVTLTMHEYGHLPWIASGLLLCLLVSYLALYTGLFAAAVRYFYRRTPGCVIFLAPSFFTALEWMRGHLLTGFPWSSLGYSQYRVLPVIQIADLTGVYGVGFVIVLVNTAIFLGLDAYKRRLGPIWGMAAVVVVTVGFVLIYGNFRLSQPMGQASTPVSVSVIQGNIAQDRKWDNTFQEETVNTYERLSDVALQEARNFTDKRPLIVWPESAMPFFFQEETRYRDRLLSLSRDKFDLLLGSLAWQPREDGTISLKNSAYLLSSTGGITRYDKMHLVPFGEYVPFSSVLSFVGKLVEGIGEFAPGREAVVMDAAGTTIGVVICFEVIFPEIVRPFVQRGATIMTTITNDAWFGDSAAPDQHFSMVVFRAVENRVAFARAANTGISGFIDGHGKILHVTDTFVEAAVTKRLYPSHHRSFYTTYGDIFAIACMVVSVCALIPSVRRICKRWGMPFCAC